MIKFYFEKDVGSHTKAQLVYLLNIWAKNRQVEVSFTESPDSALRIGRDDNSHFQLSESFVSSDPTRLVLNDQCRLEAANGKPDILATAFYMLNALQEYDSSNRDDLGRFPYTRSYQYRFKNAKENIVQQYFDTISQIAGLSPRKEKTRFLLSHDIDAVYGAVIEDGFNVLKKGRIDLFLQLLFNGTLGRPDWLNIDRIMKIESEYDCRSVFFWLVNKGRINSREKNADYTFGSKGIQQQFREVEKNGYESGLHKSISRESFREELLKYEKYGKTPVSSRYHYLKFSLPQAFVDIEESGLKLDATLGFAEEIGFRNSYGLPFNPFDVRTGKPFSFVEVPLHVMDTTYFLYKKYSVHEAEKDIFDFFERNRENCVIDILWHNNFFSNYKFKGYLDLYKKMLAYIRDNNFGTITLQEIIKNYSIN